MEDGIQAFAALSQRTRVEVLKLLISKGADGLLAGEISSQLGVRQNTMSTNLGILSRAGLVRGERHGREIRYYADFGGIRGVIAFLMEDCCGGQPEICGPILDAVVCEC